MSSLSPRQIGLLSNSVYFDVAYYERSSGNAFDSLKSAADHFNDFGWRLGLRPSVYFDTRYYLNHNPDVRGAGVNPLLHYLENGRREGRRPRNGNGRLLDPPAAPPKDVWRELAMNGAGKASLHENSLDVIVPVYRGYDDTLACLYSVFCATNQKPFRVVVIDDCSPEPELSHALGELSDLGLIYLLRNERNRGFVGTVNRALEHCGGRDCILLNSDTIVYGDWIDRLTAHAGPGVATITPWSNNATIMSYPYTLENNNQELEVDYSELDRICARVLAGRTQEIPTGVGFCFFMSSAAIAKVGNLNEEAFGKGYGEENDFCRRAANAGMQNLAALDVFVRHTGEVSFSTSATASKEIGMQALLSLHPDYLQVVSNYITRDPLKYARAALDEARWKLMKKRGVILHVDHGWGGGVETHIRSLSGQLIAENILSLRATTSDQGDFLLSVWNDLDFPNFLPLDFRNIDAATSSLHRLGVSHVHVHCLAGVPTDRLSEIRAAVAAAGLAFDYTAHDYTPVCPRITMIDWGGAYCSSPSESYCRTCLTESGSVHGVVDIREWRNEYLSFLLAARRVYCPSQDTLERFRRYMPALNNLVWKPHPVLGSWSTRRFPDEDGRVRIVGVVGAIGPHKGSNVLFQMAADAFERKLPLKFVLYGYTDRDDLKEWPNFTVTGKYASEAELDAMIEDHPPDVCLYLSVWPETFSYALDVALRNGIRPIVVDTGAPAERLRALGLGTILPFDMLYNPSSINDSICNDVVSRLPPVISEAGRNWISASEYYELHFA